MHVLHLKALLLAIEKGSISAAARSLGKKQSQVSQWISDLEVDLGVKLFDRTGNKSQLSKQGQQLLPSLIHTLAQLDKLTNKASALSQGEPIALRIGIEHYIPESAIMAPISNILQFHHSGIEIYRGEQRELRHDLVNGVTDLIIQNESGALHQTNIEYAKLGYYREGIVCSPSLLLASHQPILIDTLCQYRELIWGKPSEEQGEGYSPDYAIIDDLTMLITLLERGAGFAFLPLANIEHALNRGALIHLNTQFEQSHIPRRVELCWRAGFPLSEVGRKTLLSLKQHHQFLP
ncbi:LysR family transcriptional regulator [Vibrio ostreicida]|uniref:LysR family transcriptional regulator n=1 Tax=Vibrio ostreicida TaxID=526588 RepID=A0ABT8BZY0_9VIBR|nr:LysR family transcriptional regulator [Vibrio ostreicida]MDN3611914.1 LysR family transcriptional regulator [Vibrio ostreicida]NPD08902.1 LysR family transcriptional regulator [Vibrio ostreicida]